MTYTKKIDGIYDMLMLRHERETEQKGSSAINEKLLDNQDLCLLFQISPRSLQRYRSLGVLPYKRLGQKTYYTEEDVMQFVENNVKEFKKEECGALLDPHSSEIQITKVFTIKHLQLWYKRKRVMNRTCW